MNTWVNVDDNRDIRPMNDVKCEVTGRFSYWQILLNNILKEKCSSKLQKKKKKINKEVA